MKKILVIGSKNSGQKNNPYEIAMGVSSDDVRASVIYWEDLLFRIKPNDIQVTDHGIDILGDKPDLVIAIGWYKTGKDIIYRDIAFSLALYLKRNGIEFWNSEMINQRSISKISCMAQLAIEGISIPLTYFSIDKEQIMDIIDTPFIAKAAGASRGAFNYFINNDANKNQVYDSDKLFIVQPFIVNDHDLRVICFDGAPTLVLKRSRKKGALTHLNNTSQGGEAEWLETVVVSPELLTISSKICKVMGREMAGIDFIADTSSSYGYSCLEVNAIPQLTSGIDSDKKIAAFAHAVHNFQGDRL